MTTYESSCSRVTESDLLYTNSSHVEGGSGAGTRSFEESILAQFSEPTLYSTSAPTIAPPHGTDNRPINHTNLEHAFVYYPELHRVGTETGTIINERKKSTVRWSKRWEDLIKNFINSSPGSDSLVVGTDLWKMKLLCFLQSHDGRVQLLNVNRWVDTYSWIFTRALERQLTVRSDQDQRSQNQEQEQIRNQNIGHCQNNSGTSLIATNPQSNDYDRLILEDCYTAHKCILDLRIALHKRDHFRACLTPLDSIMKQITRVQSAALRGTPRADLLNRSQINNGNVRNRGIRMKREVVIQGSSQNQNQGQVSGDDDEDDDENDEVTEVTNEAQSQEESNSGATCSQSNDEDRLVLMDCFEVHTCILGLRKALSKRDSFRACLIPLLDKILKQVDQVQLIAIRGTR